jgi:FkbH-like protein
MMTWLPAPKDFRGDLRAATVIADSAERRERLAFLANHRLGFLETIQLDRALGPLPAAPISGFSPVRLAVLASSTVDHLLPAIRVAGLRRRLLIDVHLGAYGQYRQDLLDANSTLHRFMPQAILFALTAREAIAGVAVAATAAEVDAALTQWTDGLRQLWRTARESLKATVIQQTFLDTAPPLFGSYDRLVPAAPARMIARLNDRISEAAAQDGVLLLDAARASARQGLATWFDEARWLHAKQEIAPPAAPLYGDLVARIVAAQRGLSKKCLVLDADNTLWAGVVGDDGLDGIVLGEGSAVGEAHLALQRYAKQLKDRGIILAICSKNEMATVEAVFREHPEMLLRRSDIAAFVANWDDKAENLKQIARGLNIGVDSLVFVDDNPVERARVRESLPMVAVPELPHDAANYVSCLANAGYFEAVAFTAEDRERADQYAANAEREALLGSSAGVQDFLRGLKMMVVFGPFRTVDLARVAQLVNKTNQFNPTTRRYGAAEIAGFAATSGNITLQFRLVDRFGDNGLVSTLILRADPAQPTVLDIDSWVMSCRVFGRQLELEIMNIAVETARRRGALSFRADYLPTPKNGVVRELYPSLGFVPMSRPADGDGATRWTLDLDVYVPRPTFIARLEG